MPVSGTPFESPVKVDGSSDGPDPGRNDSGRVASYTTRPG